MVQSMQRRKRKGDRFSPFDAFDGYVNYHLPRKQMQTHKPPSNCHSGWLGRLMLTTTIIQIEIIEYTGQIFIITITSIIKTAKCIQWAVWYWFLKVPVSVELEEITMGSLQMKTCLVATGILCFLVH